MSKEFWNIWANFESLENFEENDGLFKKIWKTYEEVVNEIWTKFA